MRDDVINVSCVCGDVSMFLHVVVLPLLEAAVGRGPHIKRAVSASRVRLVVPYSRTGSGPLEDNEDAQSGKASRSTEIRKAGVHVQRRNYN